MQPSPAQALARLEHQFRPRKFLLSINKTFFRRTISIVTDG